MLSFHLRESFSFSFLHSIDRHFHILLFFLFLFLSTHTQSIHIILQLVTEKSLSPVRLKTAKTSLSINCMRRFKENSLQFRHSLQILLLLGKALIPVWKDSKDSIMAKLPWQWPQVCKIYLFPRPKQGSVKKVQKSCMMDFRDMYIPSNSNLILESKTSVAA